MANPVIDLLALPPRLIGRALEDLTTLNRTGRDAVRLLERLDDKAERILALGERIEARAATILELGERMDDRGAALLDLGERTVKEAVGVQERAEEISARAAEMIAVLPTLERAVALASPLEGAVERLGRVVDRLPGGEVRGAEREP